MEIEGQARYSIFVVTRVLLTLLLPLIGLIALAALYVGVTFGFNLFNLRDPLVTVVWLIVVSSPGWFYALLVWSERSRARSFALLGVVAPLAVAALAIFVS